MQKKILLLSFITLMLFACNAKNSEPEISSKVVPDSNTVIESVIASNDPEMEKLLDASVQDLQSMVAKGELKYADITRFYLQRIEKYNPILNAVIAVNPNALDEAKSRDLEFNNESERGMLYGLPVLLKDNIESKELATTAGSLILKNNFTERDAALVANLRAKGAIILGKTNLSEWANFRSERSSSGWSSVGGQTRNPYDTNRSPCGSSSGSAASVAAQLAPLTIGTETDGSIVCPASVNGIVAIKPTVGLVSRVGIVPLSPSQDTAGPMANSVADVALLLEGMLEVKAMKTDTFALTRPKNINLNYHKALGSILSASSIHITSMQGVGGWHKEMDDVYSSTIEKLKTSGVQMNTAEIEVDDSVYSQEYDLLLYEFKHSLNDYLSTLKAPYSSYTMEKLIELNKADAQNIMPHFEQEIFVKAQAKGSIESDDYKTIRKDMQKKMVTDGLEKYFSEHPKVQALIVPTGAPAWSIDVVNGDHFLGNSSSYAAISGYPTITMPMGTVQGLPVGVSLIARPYDEFQMIAIADKLEEILDVNLIPTAYLDD